MNDGGKDLVIGLDSSTTATKAIAWSAAGEAVAEGRSPIPMGNPGPNLYEQDPADWWRSAAEAIGQVVGAVDAGRIAGLAISNQRETFAPLDSRGAPVRPAILWVDERGREKVRPFARAFGEERIHRISGKPPDLTPCVYTWDWMRDHEPEAYAGTAMFADVHAYLVWRLTGAFRTSWASADPLGAFDLADQRWSDEILAALDLDTGRMPEAHRPGSVLGEVTRQAAQETGLRPGTPVIAGGGDGQCAGLGVGLVGTAANGHAYLNLGTAVVSGVHFTEFRADPAWRTMGAASGDGYIYESCLRTGTFLVDWFVRQVCGIDAAADPGIYDRLEAAAADAPPGARGLVVLPYFSGVMTPHWNADARGVFFGLASAHGRGDLYRALMEGIALDQAMATALVEAKTGAAITDYVAIGGGAASDLWCRIIASAAGRPVRRSATGEASSLGAAICAAVGSGLHPDMAAAARAMTGRIVDTIEPDRAWGRRYAELADIYRELYPAVEGLYDRLAAFADGKP